MLVHQILRGIRIRALRFRVLSIFSVSIATTLASIVHATLMIIKPGVWEAISGMANSFSHQYSIRSEYSIL